MPQPLNRVISNGEFRPKKARPNESVLNDKPELAKLVASIFELWASIEGSLSLLLVSVLGADAEPAIAMFATLRAQHLQMGALEAAAKAALSPNDFDVFCAAIRMTDSVQTPRNHLAHWIWGTCEQLPDALLLADLKGHQDRDRELKLAFERRERRSGRLQRLSAIIGALSGLGWDPVRNASGSANPPRNSANRRPELPLVRPATAQMLASSVCPLSRMTTRITVSVVLRRSSAGSCPVAFRLSSPWRPAGIPHLPVHPRTDKGACYSMAAAMVNVLQLHN